MKGPTGGVIADLQLPRDSAFRLIRKQVVRRLRQAVRRLRIVGGMLEAEKMWSKLGVNIETAGREIEETVMGRKALWITGMATAAAAIGGASAAVASSTPDDDQPLTGSILQQASDSAIAHTGPGTVTSAETENGANTSYEVGVRLDNGKRVEVELSSSFQVVATEHDDAGAGSGPPLSAADRDKAGQASVARVGQGRVGEVERENEGGSAYEVEIILPDGFEVDVELGADFQVLRTGAPERD